MGQEEGQRVRPIRYSAHDPLEQRLSFQRFVESVEARHQLARFRRELQRRFLEGSHSGCNRRTRRRPAAVSTSLRRRASVASAWDSTRPALSNECRVWLTETWVILSADASSPTVRGPSRGQLVEHPEPALLELDAERERGMSACRALLQALRHYRRLGVRFARPLTDNGSCYRSRVFRRLVRRLGRRHLFTRPYTPRTNGKAERFIQTALREWAYARAYDSSEQRAAHLPLWLHQYYGHRPHASLGYQPPVSRLKLPLNNVLGLHS